MGERKKWDLTSRRSLAAAAEWLRKNSDAIAVIVVRGEDTVMAVHEDAAPHDAVETVRELLPAMAEEVNQERREKRARKVAGYE